jgi:hemoglobin-like flavoprotein
MQSLSADEIERVRNSFDRLWPMSSRTADLFYERLFEIAPGVRPMFRPDMDEQKRKFISTLAVIVGTLDDTTRLVPLTVALARQHSDYGIQAKHYDVVGQALLWSLEQGLGQDWTPSLADSWSKAYGIVSGFMIEHAPPR